MVFPQIWPILHIYRWSVCLRVLHSCTDVGLKNSSWISLPSIAFSNVYDLNSEKSDPKIRNLIINASPYLNSNSNSNSKANSNSNCTELQLHESNLSIGSGAFNLVRSLDFQNKDQLTTFSVGSFSFKNVTSFELIGFPLLETVDIGSTCFSSFDTKEDEELMSTETPFRLVDCPALSTVKIGAMSFWSFTLFEVKSRNVELGSLVDCCKLEALSLQGENFIFVKNMEVDCCDSLSTLSMGHQCFEHFAKARIANCNRLESITIDEDSFVDPLDSSVEKPFLLESGD